MAIRHRPERKLPWIVYWKNPFTGKTEEEGYLTEGEAKKANSLVKHRLKYERESFRPVEASPAPADDTLEACYYLYLKAKRFNKKGLKTSLDCMKACLEILGHYRVADITTKDLDHLKKTLLHSKTRRGQSEAIVKPVTVRSWLSALRAVLNWCAEEGLIEHKPVFPKLPPAHYQHFIPPTPQELGMLWNVAPPHIKRVIVVGSQTGVRVGPSEMLKLTWKDFDPDRAVLRIQAAKKRPDQPWREAPIRQSLMPLMLQWAEEDKQKGVTHIIHYQGRKIDSITTAWATTLKRAGITREIRPYDLRHAFGTEAIAAGADVGTVAQIMGNDPKVLLTHYQHVVDRQKRAAVEALPEINFTAENYGKEKEAIPD